MKITLWIVKNKVFVIAVLSLVVAFSGINFTQFASFLESLITPAPADYKITSSELPTVFDVALPLNVSRLYFIVIHVTLSNKETAIEQNLRLSFRFEDKGKNAVSNPELLLYFTDSLQQVRAIWQHKPSQEEMDFGFTVDYSFPPPDQLALGSWKIIAFLHNNTSGELVSYSIIDFTVTESQQENFLIVVVSGLVLGFLASLVTAFFWFLIKKYRDSPTDFYNENASE